MVAFGFPSFLRVATVSGIENGGNSWHRVEGMIYETMPQKLWRFLAFAMFRLGFCVLGIASDGCARPIATCHVRKSFLHRAKRLQQSIAATNCLE